jgi:hypothetical protein
MLKIRTKGDFLAVAQIICSPVPEWLPVALAHYALWIDGSDTSEVQAEFNKRIRQMQEAVRVLENSLPIWEQAAFDLACPPAVKMVLEALPGLKAEITKLNRRSVGRRPDALREVCAAVIVEAWRMVHGKVEARSEQLYRACDGYWVECGGAPVGDIDNWRWTVERAMKSDHSWINEGLMSISYRQRNPSLCFYPCADRLGQGLPALVWQQANDRGRGKIAAWAP